MPVAQAVVWAQGAGQGLDPRSQTAGRGSSARPRRRSCAIAQKDGSGKDGALDGARSASVCGPVARRAGGSSARFFRRAAAM